MHDCVHLWACLTFNLFYILSHTVVEFDLADALANKQISKQKLLRWWINFYTTIQSIVWIIVFSFYISYFHSIYCLFGILHTTAQIPRTHQNSLCVGLCKTYPLQLCNFFCFCFLYLLFNFRFYYVFFLILFLLFLFLSLWNLYTEVVFWILNK